MHPHTDSIVCEPAPPKGDGGVQGVTVIEVTGKTSRERQDQLTVEEPLGVRITFGPLRNRTWKVLSITMRTPGHDPELAAGFLFTEGIVSDPAQILALEPGAGGSVVRVDLHPSVGVDHLRLERHVYTTSSCGICGKTSLEAVDLICEGPRAGGKRIPAEVVHSLPQRLRDAQPTFDRTGGLHAAALFDADGNLCGVREDVGRHNAVDKLIGTEFLANRLPLADRILFVSGRASFELVQKAAMAGAPVFAAVGAPSSLAVQLADRLGVSLLGFVRDGRFNVYAGAERIAL